MKRKKTITEISCDLCKQVKGTMVGRSGYMGDKSDYSEVKMNSLKCGHDICGDCWYWENNKRNRNRCPICHPHLGHPQDSLPIAFALNLKKEKGGVMIDKGKYCMVRTRANIK